MLPIYRKAIAADARELARIRSLFIAEISNLTEKERVNMERCNKEYFDTSFANDSFAAWVAVNENEIIATSGLSFSVVPPNATCIDGRVAYIMNIFTLPEYRRQGIATNLFKLILEEAKIRGYKRITLNATSKGKPLYEKFGFKDVIGDMAYYAL